VWVELLVLQPLPVFLRELRVFPSPQN